MQVTIFPPSRKVVSGVTGNVGEVVRSGSISQNTTSTSQIDMTGATVTLKTSGKPVIIEMVPDPSTGFSVNVQVASSGQGGSGYVYLFRNGVQIQSASLGYFQTPTASTLWSFLSVPTRFYDATCPAGTNTYKLQWKAYSPGYLSVSMILQATEQF